MEPWLQELIARGKQTGVLTWAEVIASCSHLEEFEQFAAVEDCLCAEGIVLIEDSEPETSAIPLACVAIPDLLAFRENDAAFTEVYRRDAAFEQQLRSLGVPYSDAMCFHEPDTGRVFDAELIIPGEQALTAWLALRNAVSETRLWPVIEREQNEPKFPHEPEQIDPCGRAREWWKKALQNPVQPLQRLTPDMIRADAATNIATAEKVPPTPWTFRRFDGQKPAPVPPDVPDDDREPPEPNFGELFSNAGPFRAHKQGGGHPDYPTFPFIRIRLYPTTAPWEVFAYSPYGGWNHCPWPDEQLVMLRHWHAVCGAELVSVPGDWYELFVPHPPRTRHQAYWLAQEMGHFGEETFYGYGSYTHPDPIEAIRTSHYWYFWWD